jgi:malyl-CoA/(S)-citramalyl-CoA lyase
MTAPRLTRTYLAVPAHRARMVQGAAASTADAVFMDLEDAVPPAEKTAALEAAADALTAYDWGRKTVAVRLNAIDSPSIQTEIARLGGLRRLDAFIIPKAEVVADVARIGQWITEAAGSHGAPVSMELLIETARGLVNVEALAAADPLVTALHLGVGDFAASIGARLPIR